MAPIQKPGRSKQDYCTPPEFLLALKKRLAIEEFSIDLAADCDNRVTHLFYTEQDNALIQPWGHIGGWAYCNPPFAHLEPWVDKAAVEGIHGASIAMLVPASVGANWWRLCVDGLAHVLFLNGRLAFMPDKPKWLYPKDCALLLYTPYIFGGYEVWDWRAEC